jgi:hypothetical protein
MLAQPDRSLAAIARALGWDCRPLQLPDMEHGQPIRCHGHLGFVLGGCSP